MGEKYNPEELLNYMEQKDKESEIITQDQNLFNALSNHGLILLVSEMQEIKEAVLKDLGEPTIPLSLALTYSLQDIIDAVQYGFDYREESQNNGKNVPVGNSLQWLMAKKNLLTAPEEFIKFRQDHYNNLLFKIESNK